MGANSKISWTVNTFNPWVGCSRIHAGCLHCYAETYANYTGIAEWGPSGTRYLSKGPWREVLKWDAAAKARGEKELVFCASLADIFEDWRGPMTANRAGDVWHVCDATGVRVALPRREYRDGCRLLTINDVRADLFRLIDKCQNLIFQLLTKRPENIRAFWPHTENGGLRYRENVWLGTSISDQETAHKWGPRLLAAARDLAPVLFYSMEPLVGPVNLISVEKEVGAAKGGCPVLPLIDWVIIGGESGKQARYCKLEWIREILAHCEAAGVPAFVKQIGAKAEEWSTAHREGNTGPYVSNTIRDDKGGDMAEWRPEWKISVREWPKVFAGHA